MPLMGFKSGGGPTLLCGHRVSHPKDAPGSGRGRLPPVSGQCWTLPASPWVFKAEILP